MPVCSPRKFLPGDEGGTGRTWGLRAGTPCTQYLGNVPLQEGLSIGFPNMYQHRFTPATLENSDQEGRMSILSFFLVDPDLSAQEPGMERKLGPTTWRVPPQQKEWVRKAVDESIDVRIPNEVVTRIVDFVSNVWSEDRARAVAKEMKREREHFWTMHNEKWGCLPFDVNATGQ